ncbi:LuxR C-terminal-related transcriptional regulator [Zavarzinia compransoris]|uniref:LuxR C-terminal-related transcriptional regulator n=1 Tax=Zavarzinia marina TaxID=2911065 RepID=UPI001F40D7A6|nr:LuxR C-terminal-related transcriptional regulator [Zavarzinia marina]MCF4165868.1 LuxR C-terminal-related transcriptional regulator [Zavarzinia marina]
MRRKNLDDYFENLPAHTVTMVRAPAGFGKTTLLADWRKRLLFDGARVAWLSLDFHDNEPTQLLTYLLGALDQAFENDRQTGTSFLSASGNMAPSQVAGFIVNEVQQLGDDIYVFLDDVHELNSAPVLSVLYDLLHYAPPNLHFVLAGRPAMWLGLSRLKLQGRVQETDIGEMRFDIAEAIEFFRLRGHNLLRLTDIDTLNQATEGWVAGLCLAAQSLNRKRNVSEFVETFCGETKEITDYIRETVFRQIGEEDRRWLVRVSILSRFCPNLCDTLLDTTDSEARIHRLIEEVPFIIPLEGTEGWARLHPLLREFLAGEVGQMEAEELRALHKRAATWFSSRGEISEAIHHAIEEGDTARAIGMIARQSRHLVETAQILLLMSWYERLPKSLFVERLDLSVDVGWALTLSMRMDEAAATIAGVEKALAARPDPGRHVHFELQALKAAFYALNDRTFEGMQQAEEWLASGPRDDQFKIGALANVLTYCKTVEGDFAAALDAQVIGESWSAAERSRFTVVYAACVIGQAHEQLGDFAKARDCFEEALRHGEEAGGRRSVPASLPASCLAGLLYDLGDLEGAQKLLAGRFDIACSRTPPSIGIRGPLSLVRVHAADGDMKRALERLDRLEAIAHRLGFIRIVAACLVQRLHFALLANDWRQVRHLLNRLEQMRQPEEKALGRTARSVTNEIICLGMARADCVLGEARRNLAYLQEYLAKAEAMGRFGDQVEGRILLAASLWACGEQAEALDVFRNALAAAMPRGFTRIFREMRLYLLPLLKGVEASTIGEMLPKAKRDFIADLLHPGKEPAASRSEVVSFADANRPQKPVPERIVATREEEPATQPLYQQLTGREREVLACMAEGLTNKEIAVALAITPETVKWYAKQIFVKLGANTRTQAVRQARRARVL